MNRLGLFAGGLVLGVGLMYLLDPDRGNQRRALIRDRTVRGVNRTREFLAQKGHDLKDRARGVAERLHPHHAGSPDMLRTPEYHVTG